MCQLVSVTSLVMGQKEIQDQRIFLCRMMEKYEGTALRSSPARAADSTYY